jgi:arylsulfatase B
MMSLLPTALLSAAAAARPAAAAMSSSQPHLVFALTDDLGWNYPGYHNPEVISPTLDKLAIGGVRLESHYTYKYCSPTRASFLTGRMPYHLPNVRCNLIPSSSPEGTPLGYSMLPLLLAPAGCECAADAADA